MAEVLSQNQIDALLSAALSGTMDLGASSEEPEKKYRKYDFYSPRKFTKDRLRILNGIFDNYTRILNSRINGLLHTGCDVEIESIEEQRYYEFSNALIEGDVLTVAHLHYKDQVEETPILLHVTRPVMLSMIDRLIGGAGDPDDDLAPDYSFTSLELKLYETIIKDFISIMGSSWENYINLDFSYNRVEVNPTFVQLISLDETVVIVDIKLTFPNCVGRMSICLPGMMLTNLFAEISRESTSIRSSNEDKSEDIFSTLRNSELELVIELCRTQLRLQDIYHLNEGDVIHLNRPKDSPVYVNIGARRWFEGKMGVSNKNLAIIIGETYSSQEGDVEQDGK
jgi:flagellar motor switch protein FliM